MVKGNERHVELGARQQHPYEEGTVGQVDHDGGLIVNETRFEPLGNLADELMNLFARVTSFAAALVDIGKAKVLIVHQGNFGYLLKSGSRFSLNASRPSFASSVV